MKTENWEEEIVKYLGEDQHANCDDGCSKKYYEEKNKQDLIDDVTSLLKQKERETLEMVRDELVPEQGGSNIPGRNVDRDEAIQEFIENINKRIKELEE